MQVACDKTRSYCQNLRTNCAQPLIFISPIENLHCIIFQGAQKYIFYKYSSLSWRLTLQCRQIRSLYG